MRSTRHATIWAKRNGYYFRLGHLDTNGRIEAYTEIGERLRTTAEIKSLKFKKELAEMTDGFNGGDIEAFWSKAGIAAVTRHLTAKKIDD